MTQTIDEKVAEQLNDRQRKVLTLALNQQIPEDGIVMVRRDIDEGVSDVGRWASHQYNFVAQRLDNGLDATDHLQVLRAGLDEIGAHIDRKVHAARNGGTGRATRATPPTAAQQRALNEAISTTIQAIGQAKRAEAKAKTEEAQYFESLLNMNQVARIKSTEAGRQWLANRNR